ncbi:MAG: hypothetical protein G01um10148_133 [Parcubacteria group bacterium Gr01-1014_8]|nr:MAG: hypothetical protein G01um10148_133 [Parcubacteria group bacterium Gr01-1014_8]
MVTSTFAKFRLPRVATLDDLFGIDVRSLALVRVSIGALILYDLFVRAISLTEHYGDNGVFSSALIQSYWPFEYAWSLHLLAGGPLVVVVTCFIVHACATAALLVGYKTRIATFLTFMLQISLYHANPILLYGVDDIIRTVLFVGIFLPWGAAYSFDSYFRQTASPHKRALSMWTAAFLLQLGFYYLFAASTKIGPEWLDGSAVYYALSFIPDQTSLGVFMMQFPHLLTLATFGVLILQSIALILLFSPIFTMSLRLLALGALIGMHASFGVLLQLGIFSWVAIAALLAFMPSFFWDAIEHYLGRNPPIAKTLKSEEQKTIFQALCEATAAMLGFLYIVYIFTWQASNSTFFQSDVHFPNGLVVVAKVLRIDQTSGLFAPSPPRSSGWYVISGQLADGEEIDLLRDGAPATYERSDSMEAVHRTYRVQSFMLNTMSWRYPEYRPTYAAYLCKKWNENNFESRRLLQVKLIYMAIETPEPGIPPSPVERVTLYEQTCS